MTDNIVESLLLPGEKVLWTGAPSARKYALLSMPSIVDIVIAVILILIGAIFGFCIEVYLVVPIVVNVFGGVLIAAGVFMLLFSPSFAYIAAGGMVYAVTTERLLVIDKRARKITRQHLPADLGDTPATATEAGCVYFTGASKGIGFDYIVNAQQVAALIDSTFRKKTSP